MKDGVSCPFPSSGIPSPDEVRLLHHDGVPRAQFIDTARLKIEFLANSS